MENFKKKVFYDVNILCLLLLLFLYMLVLVTRLALKQIKGILMSVNKHEYVTDENNSSVHICSISQDWINICT